MNIIQEMWLKIDLTKFNIVEEQFFDIIKLKSVSILKKIFYFSIIEFTMSIIFNFFVSFYLFNNDFENVDKQPIIISLNVLNYLVIIFFIIKFYINFNKIELDSNVNELNRNILKSRKNVYNYIKVSLILFNFSSLIFAFYFLIEKYPYENAIIINNTFFNPELFYLLFFFILSLMLTIYTFLIWNLYRFFYLRLINNLIFNDEELNKSHY